ncbi:MAG: DUF5610 domain-containing protein [Piscirickettsiaceae bacterium]|nr:DUF5610 domain-containing protein [Piscirickettsiaceae bacterium]
MDVQLFSQSVRSLAKADDKKESGPIGPEVSELAHAKNAAKKQLNAAILESTINANLTAGNDSQSLVLKTALEGINEALRETFGDDSIQTAYEAGIDVSPEATADRIVSLSTGFLSLYQQQHPELSQEEAVTAFVDIISGGIDTGFTEARDILTSLNVLQGEIASNIDKTYDLVQEKLAAFIESFNVEE